MFIRSLYLKSTYAGKIPDRIPIKITNAKSIFNVSAISNGPEVGTTIEWAITPQQPMAIINSGKFFPVLFPKLIASGNIRKNTVPMNTEMESINAVTNSAISAFDSPNTFMNRFIIRSTAPLSIKATPNIDATAITNDTFPAVFPKVLIEFSTAKT